MTLTLVQRRKILILALGEISSEVHILAFLDLENSWSLIQCSSTLMQRLAAVSSSLAECPGCGAPPVLGTCALATRWTQANVSWPWCKWSSSRTVSHLWIWYAIKNMLYYIVRFCRFCSPRFSMMLAFTHRSKAPSRPSRLYCLEM